VARTQVRRHRQKRNGIKLYLAGLLTVNLMKIKLELLKLTSDTQYYILSSVFSPNTFNAFKSLQLSMTLLRSFPGHNVLHPIVIVTQCSSELRDHHFPLYYVLRVPGLVLPCLGSYWSTKSRAAKLNLSLKKFRFCLISSRFDFFKFFSLSLEIRGTPLGRA